MQPPSVRAKTDHAHAAARIAANLIPFVGGALAELFGHVFSSSLDRRKEQWLREMGSAIEELCVKVAGLTPEALSKDESFISICLHASTIALRSHQQEKLDALRSAVVNSVGMDEVRELKASFFIRLVDEFSTLHLRILDVYSRPKWYLSELQARNPTTRTHYPSLAAVWDEYGLAPNSNDPLVKMAERELALRGLAYSESLEMPSRTQGMLSPLGKEFFEFIRSPECRVES